jgi:hypothetical protein
MQEADSKLFEQSIYSRSCAKPLVTKTDPVPETRMPVLLTEEEYENISKNHRNTYTEAISYSSEDNNKFWYICPKYFALKENRSLSQEEVDSGKFGKVIPGVPRKDFPKDSKGYNILQFNKEHIYPGFLKPEKHPKNKCMPCCFKSWDKPANIKLRKECMSQDNDVKPRKKKTTTYIEKGHPLKEGAQGYLDPQVLHLLGVSNKTCNDKPAQGCFLRRGVQAHKSQTFIASIAKLRKETESFTIEKMKEHMMKNMTITQFVTIQNGNLVDIFYDADIEVENDVVTKFKTEILWEIVQKWSDMESNAYYERVLRAFQNFKTFLSDNSVVIDHTFLWDYVCMPRVVDDSGINLVILELDSDTAITNSINILCPTNHYVSSPFEETKKTAVLFKKGNHFEPIFQRKETDKYLFSFNNPKLGKTLQKIKKALVENCNPSNELPSYEFDQNISYSKLMRLLEQLTDKKGTPRYVKTKNVLSYNGKIIGVLLMHNNNEFVEEAKGQEQEVQQGEFMLPCRPSPLMYYDDDYELQTSDNNIWLHNVVPQSYNATRDFLSTISDETNGAIKSKPMIKISNDDNVIGLLTVTDQYVPVLPINTEDTLDDGLDINEYTDYIHVEKSSSTNKIKDDNRMIKEMYHGLILEYKIYNMFRTYLRALLNHENNRSYKQNIQDVIDSRDNYTYTQKLDILIPILHRVLDNYVKFLNVDDNDKNILLLSEQTPCMDMKNCKILISKYNLFNRADNEITYFGRIADELIRYHVLKTFILSRDFESPILLLSPIKADINKDEIIVGKNQLDQDYFRALKSTDRSIYEKYESYDTQTHNAKIDETPENIEDMSRVYVELTL